MEVNYVKTTHYKDEFEKDPEALKSKKGLHCLHLNFLHYNNNNNNHKDLNELQE